jgi:hypothetical protein
MIVWILVIGVASYRLFRLFSIDAVTETPREWVYAHTPDWVEDLGSCSWCAGSWWAFGVTWLTDATIGLPAPVLVALGAATVVGVLGRWL